MKTVYIRFDDYAKDYHYLYNLPDPIEPGDFVIVSNRYSGYKVVEVRKVDEGVTLNATAHIIDKVDLTAHKARMETEAKRSELLKKLKSLEKKQSEMDRLRHLAERNAEAKTLLDQLEALS